jgi:hypothetical protein
MIHLFIAYDDKDTKIGEYFINSQEHLTSALKATCLVQLFDTDAINGAAIETAISALNTANPNTPFVFVNYTHGKTDSLHTDEKEFINAKNTYYFGNSLFYACSCLAGVSLKDSLMANNCTFFMGYNNTISSIYPETEHLFYICENTVILDFLSKNTSIINSITAMYEQYENFIIDDNVDSATALILGRNRDCFVYQGNENLTRNDFSA